MAKPKPPSYKKEQFVTVFTNQQVKIKDGHICFTKTILSPLKTNVTNICQVRIIPQASCHVIEVVYEKEITDLKLHPSRVLSLDLGISNFATSINNAGLTPFIVNGKPIKAFNQWYNKCKAELQSNLKGKRFSSRRIEKITHYRNCWINDKMHKISRFIVDYCIKKDIGTIVIGKNKNWKQQVNIGAKNNQQFTNIPHVKLIEKIRYKAEMVGIKFVETEESYTSKCDALVLEPIQKHDCYKGKRIKRGLFVSSNGKLINADINGAINIARKVIGDDFVKSLLNSGIGQMPYRINIL